MILPYPNLYMEISAIDYRLFMKQNNIFFAIVSFQKFCVKWRTGFHLL